MNLLIEVPKLLIFSVSKINRRPSHPTATFLFATPIFVTSVGKFPKLNTYTSCLQFLLPKLQLLRQNLVKTLIFALFYLSEVPCFLD